MPAATNRYQRILEAIFFTHYEPGKLAVPFRRADILEAAHELGIEPPKNLGDVLYSLRYREGLPARIAETAPEGKEWIIRSTGKGEHVFAQVARFAIVPSSLLAETKIPDSTPGIIEKYALSDEQALLAKVRYNRLIDIFVGLACYSLQNHLRTTVPRLGQVETDEIYVGIDKRGAHYVVPVQAKGGRDRIGRVQLEQDMRVCAAKFPDLICRPVAAQFMSADLIALFEFVQEGEEVRIVGEKHYRLVRPENLSMEELASYKRRPLDA